jgi:hypothetical protein
MKRHKDKGRIEGPFIPILITTRRSPAWRALSPYAREVYHSLRSRYGLDARNNGHIYLSTRDGAEETGFNDKTVARCLRELAHYGFIVMTEPGCLGVNGRGKAPHWRLTELGHMREPPTRDFLKWDGEMFHEQRSPAYYKRQDRNLVRLRRGQKQNPAPLYGADCTDQRCIPVHQGAVQLSEKAHQSAVHINESACTTDRHISRVNHSPAQEQSLPVLEEVSMAAVEINGQNCTSPDASALAERDLRGMPADLSKLYEPWPDYEWLDKQDASRTIAR